MRRLDELRTLLNTLISAGGVSEEKILEAECQLGVRFPPSYRYFLSQYGAVNGAPYELTGLAPGEHGGDEPPFWSDVVASTLRIRRAARGFIPKKYVLISDDGGDYIFYLDTNRTNSDRECPVIVLGPGADAVTVASDFVDFLKRIYDGTLAF